MEEQWGEPVPLEQGAETTPAPQSPAAPPLRDDLIKNVKPVEANVECDDGKLADETVSLERENVVIVGNSSSINECVHNKKGWCEVHREFAKKFCYTYKIWGKKKNGLFGNLIRKKTTYRCMGRGDTADGQSQNSQDCSTNNHSQIIAQQIGEGDIRTIGNIASRGLVGVGLSGALSQKEKV